MRTNHHLHPCPPIFVDVLFCYICDSPVNWSNASVVWVTSSTSTADPPSIYFKENSKTRILQLSQVIGKTDPLLAHTVDGLCHLVPIPPMVKPKLQVSWLRMQTRRTVGLYAVKIKGKNILALKSNWPKTNGLVILRSMCA